MAALFTRRLHGLGFEEFPALGAWFARPSVQPATAEIAEADRALSPALAHWPSS